MAYHAKKTLGISTMAKKQTDKSLLTLKEEQKWLHKLHSFSLALYSFTSAGELLKALEGKNPPPLQKQDGTEEGPACATSTPEPVFHFQEQKNPVQKNFMAQLCEVDSIEVRPGGGFKVLKTSPHTYTHSLKSEGLVLHFVFHKHAISVAHKKFLRKAGKVLEDVFLRLKTLSRLKHRKEQWELAFDIITIPLCLTDTKGCILRSNKSFRQKTGKTKEDILQKNCFSVFFNNPELQNMNKNLLTSLKHKRTNTQGQEEVFEVSLQPLSLKSQKDIQFVSFKDITLQTQKEQHIAFQAQSKERGIISKSIAHELNNPICGMMLLLETIPSHTLVPHLRKDLNEIHLALKRCLQIIKDLLVPPQAPDKDKKTTGLL